MIFRYLAAQRGRDKCLEQLINCKANIDFEMPLNTYGRHVSVPNGNANAKGWDKYHLSGSDPNQAGFERGNGATAV